MIVDVRQQDVSAELAASKGNVAGAGPSTHNGRVTHRTALGSSGTSVSRRVTR